jgi:anthranilate phosphoribosyltransferase
MAGVIAGRGNRGLVFHGEDGLDELTTTAASSVWVIGDGRVAQSRLDPAELGIAAAGREDLVGGDPAHNAGVVADVLAGRPGPVRDIVALNAAAAQLAFAGPDLEAPLAAQFAGPLRRAYEAIDSGAAAGVLDTWVRVSQAARPS